MVECKFQCIVDNDNDGKILEKMGVDCSQMCIIRYITIFLLSTTVFGFEVITYDGIPSYLSMYKFAVCLYSVTCD